MKGTLKALATLVTAAVLAVGVGSLTGCKKKRKVECSKLCKRMGNCFFEIMQKQGKLSKSTIKIMKDSKTLRKNFKKRMRKYCKRTCKNYNKKRKWSKKDVKRVKGCLKKPNCQKFAKCITSVL